jgi:hypothetical protein
VQNLGFVMRNHIAIALTWDESNGNANDQVDGEVDQLKGFS